ncbi:MAG: hypothetical protein KZQ95_21385 [Candidatus Thiodiazotropha sp. (ex Epidulcina cf. delphinae)]|nr:hypothetical protein [Candidatus Thiodiazotropha sp. (ex Epidulcina cf. delphinae)]
MRSSLFDFDGEDQAALHLIEVIDPLNQSTRFSYDNRDNLIAVTDPNNHATRYTYDRADRKTREIRPGGQIIAYTYDPAGNLTSTTDPDGRKTVNSYDEANQLISQAHYAPGQTTAERTITYSYDPNGNLIGWSDGTLSATRVYDENNRKTQETVNYGTFSLTHRYTYDAAGNKQSYTGPDNMINGDTHHFCSFKKAPLRVERGFLSQSSTKVSTKHPGMTRTLTGVLISKPACFSQWPLS